MKTSKQIKQDIKKNGEKIALLQAELDRLEMKDARRAASGNIKKLCEISETVREQNGERVAEICEEIYLLKVAGFVLADNLKAATLAEALPIIADIVKVYEGKPYGEKTREKMRDAARSQGYAFFFDGYSTRDCLEIAALDANGCCYGNDYITLYTSYEHPFVDEQNKIHFDLSKIRSHYAEKYAENPRKRAREIIKAYEAYRKEAAKAEAAQNKLNALLPEKIDSFNQCREPYRTLSV